MVDGVLGGVGPDRNSPRPVPLRTLVTVAMLANAFLSVATAVERDTQPTAADLITLTANEFHRLFDALLVATNLTITTLLAWSRWRRRHQHRARLPNLPATRKPMIPIYGCSTRPC